MSQADGSAMNVQLVWIDVQKLVVGDSDHAESFVDFPQSNVVLVRIGFAQQLSDSIDWGEGKVYGVNFGVLETYDSR